MESSDERQVVQATARLIEQARETVPGYAAGLHPTTTAELAPLYVATGTRHRERRYEAATGMALPYRGGHLMGVEHWASRADQVFSIRHEFGHILAGEVEAALFLTAEDTLSYSERRADLFAIADITPTRWMHQIAPRRPAKSVTLDLVQAYRELTAGWTDLRLWDRGRLRLALYRTHGI